MPGGGTGMPGGGGGKKLEDMFVVECDNDERAKRKPDATPTRPFATVIETPLKMQRAT